MHYNFCNDDRPHLCESRGCQVGAHPVQVCDRSEAPKLSKNPWPELSPFRIQDTTRRVNWSNSDAMPHLCHKLSRVPSLHQFVNGYAQSRNGLHFQYPFSINEVQEQKLAVLRVFTSCRSRNKTSIESSKMVLPRTKEDQ